MEANINNILENYRKMVAECFYFAAASWNIDENIQKIQDEYKLESISDYDTIEKQFKSFEKEDLREILDLLDIESDDNWTTANRCEASALTLWKYIFD